MTVVGSARVGRTGARLPRTRAVAAPAATVTLEPTMRTTTTRTRRALAGVAGLALLLAACGDDVDDTTPDATEEEADGDEAAADYDISDQPDDATASFVSPADGDTVTGPLTVELEADGVDLVPADAPVAGEAHLHVIVDQGCTEPGEVIPGPSDEATADGYNHYGDGSTGGDIELEPGDYELCVQLADGVHRAFGETETISVTVE